MTAGAATAAVPVGCDVVLLAVARTGSLNSAAEVDAALTTLTRA